MSRATLERDVVTKVRRCAERYSGVSARQFIELPPRFDQDWHVGIGVFPAGEKRPVRGAAALDVTGQGERARLLQALERIEDCDDRGTTMIEHLLELRGCSRCVFQLEIGESSCVYR